MRPLTDWQSSRYNIRIDPILTVAIIGRLKLPTSSMQPYRIIFILHAERN